MALSIRTLLLFLLPLLLFAAAPAGADEEALKNYLRAHPELTEENVFGYEDGDGSWLLSIGMAPILKKGPESALNAMKTAEMRAQGELMKHLHGVFSSSQQEIREVTVIRGTDAIPTNGATTRTLNETLREQGEGALRNVKRIDRWKNEAASDYLVAVGVRIPP